MPPPVGKIKEKNPRYQYRLHPGCNVIESLILSVYCYRAEYDKPVCRRYIEKATGLSHTTIVKAHKALIDKGLLDVSRNLIAHSLPETYLYFDSGLCKSLKFNEILILGALKIIVSRRNYKKSKKTDEIVIADSEISGLTGLSGRTIRHIRPKLAEKGYIDHTSHKGGSTWRLLNKGPAKRPGPAKPANKPTGKINPMMDEFKKLYKTPIADKDMPAVTSGLQRLYGIWQKLPKQYTRTTSPGNFGQRAIVRTLFEDLDMAFIAPITFRQEFFWQKLDTYLIANGYLDEV